MSLDDGEYWGVSKTPTHVLSRLASMDYRMVYTGYVPAQGSGKHRTSWTMELIDR